jgi:hypothetical protein
MNRLSRLVSVTTFAAAMLPGAPAGYAVEAEHKAECSKINIPFIPLIR